MNNMISFFMNLVNSGGSPQQAVMQILQQQSQNNPMAANLLELSQKGDYASIEAVARNMCKEKGLDFDSEFNNFKQNFK